MLEPNQNTKAVELSPMDEFNRRLIENVHPAEWVNPQPASSYNLVIVGAGTAGLVTAAIGASLGAKVAIIERQLMGGDCLNFGCVPSKGIIRAARARAELRNAEQFGIHLRDSPELDFGAAMQRMRRLRARISRADSAKRYSDLGVDVFIGEGRFIDQLTIAVGEQRLSFAKAVICTGARAVPLPIPGLEEAGFLTNETIFSLTEQPRRLAVIGGGPVGCEMAQTFARFGSDVMVFEQESRILPREDAEAAAIVQQAMQRDGVGFACDVRIVKIGVRGSEKLIRYQHDGITRECAVDEILVSIGRAPNVEGLGLENAGINFDNRAGVRVDSRLQTSNPRVYAAGDICFPLKFTHSADAQAQIVIQNALFPHPFGLGYARTEDLVIPWCTYTSPEIAHVGLYAEQALQRGIEIDTFTFGLDEVDRAVLDGETEGFARVHVRKGRDEILGATIVAAHAGELISQITLAMNARVGLGKISSTIFPYPTQAEVIKKVANSWRRTKLTPARQRLLRKLFARRR